MRTILLLSFALACLWGCKKNSMEETVPVSPQEKPLKECRLTSETIDSKPYRTYQ